MKQYHRYRMDFQSHWLRWSAVCVGLAMFLRVICYLGFQYIEETQGLFWKLWLPVALGLGYTVLLRGFRFNAPGIYAIIGVLMCVSLLAGAFTSGNIMRILLALPGYILCGGVLILCAGGYLPGRLPAAVCFGVLLGCRVLLFDLGRVSGMDLMTTFADWASLAALVCLPMGMVPGQKKE